jgi:hypothetical protein
MPKAISDILTILENAFTRIAAWRTFSHPRMLHDAAYRLYDQIALHVQ